MYDRIASPRSPFLACIRIKRRYPDSRYGSNRTASRACVNASSTSPLAASASTRAPCMRVGIASARDRPAGTRRQVHRLAPATPDPVPLRTKYHAITDGTNGDTRLERIDTSFLRTSLVAKGSVVALTQGQIEGRTDPNLETRVMPVGSIGFGL